MRTYTIVVEPEPTGGYWVFVPALPGCFTRGDTVKECRETRPTQSPCTSQGLRPTANRSRMSMVRLTVTVAA